MLRDQRDLLSVVSPFTTQGDILSIGKLRICRYNSPGSLIFSNVLVTVCAIIGGSSSPTSNVARSVYLEPKHALSDHATFGEMWEMGHFGGS
jgi:hypothetical protein